MQSIHAVTSHVFMFLYFYSSFIVVKYSDVTPHNSAQETSVLNFYYKNS